MKPSLQKRRADLGKMLIEFWNENFIRFGLKEEGKVKKEALMVTDLVSGKKVNVSEAKILSLHPSALFTSIEEGRAFVKELEGRIQQEIENIDAHLLWETLKDLNADFDWKIAVEFYYGESHPSSEKISAMKRVLHQNSVYFKRKNEGFVAKSPEAVAQEQTRLRQTQLNQEKKATVKKHLELLGTFQANAEEDEVQKILDHLQACLRMQERAPLFTYYQTLIEERFPAFLPYCYQVLLHYKRIDPALEPECVLRGISESFSEKVLQEANQLALRSPDGVPLPEGGICFSIDDQDTREKDDAIYAKYLENGHLLVGILIANPSDVVPRGSAVDMEAQEKGTTFYLPDRMLPMLPEILSCETCSLLEKELRSALGGWFEVDTSGHIVRFFLEKNVMVAQASLTYDQLDEWITSSFQTPTNPEIVALTEKTGKNLIEIQKLLESLLHFAEKLRTQRLAQGALLLNRQEFSVKVRQGKIFVKRIKINSPAYFLVSEMMILINSALAQYAKENHIPLIYRCQEPSELPEILNKDEYQPALYEKVFRQMKPSRFSVKPEPHFGLGVSCYAQISSPIRRYIDLVLQRQLLHYLQKQTLLYRENDLLKLYAATELQTKMAKEVESRCKARWLKKWLAELPAEQPIFAYVLEPNGSQQRVELGNCGLVASLYSSKNYPVGSTLEVVLKSVPDQDRPPRVRPAKGNTEENEGGELLIDEKDLQEKT